MSSRLDTSGPIRILVTGFGPYPGAELNASQWLAENLGREIAPGHGSSIAAAILPAAWERAGVHAEAWTESLRPHAILHFGVRPASDGFGVETRARNVTINLPDVGGALPPAPWAKRGGAARLAADLGSPLLVQALRRRNITARLSHDAGGYLCNYVFYRTLHWAARQRRAPLVGFFHVPPIALDADLSSTMSAEELLVGGRLILRYAAGLARRRTRR
jgi:pyroglutamyl-peptidase